MLVALPVLVEARADASEGLRHCVADIDGALVGGASLVAEKFDKIIHFN